MQILIATFQSIIILLGIGLIGFLIIAKKIVPRNILQVLSPLVLEIALPCMVFSDIMIKFDPQKLVNWWFLPLWWIGMTIYFLLLTLIVLFFKKKNRSEFGISLFFPNAVFVPLIIIPGLFGNNSPLIVELYIFTILFPLALFNLSILFFPRKNGAVKTHFNWRRVFNNVFIAVIAAITIKLSGISFLVPDFIISIFTRIGGLSIPLIMILIGGNIYIDFQNREKINWVDSGLFVLIKNIIFPLLTLSLILIIKPPKDVAFLIFLQSTLPPVTIIPVITERNGGNTSLTNQYLLLSFIFSLITIPAAMYVFDFFYP